MRLFLCSILMFLPVIYCGKSQVNVRIDTTVCFQTFSGWVSASFLTSECDTNYALLRDAVLPVLIDSVGITRFRLEVRSGSENSVDNYRYYLDANCPSGNDSNYLKWRASRYATVNDNNDTSINFDGFHFTE